MERSSPLVGRYRVAICPRSRETEREREICEQINHTSSCHFSSSPFALPRSPGFGWHDGAVPRRAIIKTLGATMPRPSAVSSIVLTSARIKKLSYDCDLFPAKFTPDLRRRGRVDENRQVRLATKYQTGGGDFRIRGAGPEGLFQEGVERCLPQNSRTKLFFFFLSEDVAFFDFGKIDFGLYIFREAR